MRVSKPIEYINQEVGWTVFRQVWNREDADIIILPTPPAIRGADQDVPRSYVEFIPETPAEARTQQVVRIDFRASRATVEALRAIGYPHAAAQVRMVRDREGQLELPPSGGTPIVVAHELGHTIGLTHEDDPGQTITSGGWDISLDQQARIEALLGTPIERVLPTVKVRPPAELISMPELGHGGSYSRPRPTSHQLA